MSDILDENKEKDEIAENEDGMLIIFPDENDDEEEETAAAEEDDDDGESFSLSFGKVNAARKEEEFSFMPFLNIPEVVDEEEEDDDDGEGFSLSFGKVSAAKKERDYVYMPFLNVDESAAEEEEKQDEDDDDDDDSGIDVVGGDLFDMAPLKTRESSSKAKNTDRGSSKAQQSGKKQPPQKRGKGGTAQQKKKPQKNSAPQKPNKVQQILAQMDPDIIASVSSDPRQMILLEETIRSELIKQAAHNAVARELGVDTPEVREPQKKRPAQQGKQRNGGGQSKAPAGLNFSRQQIPQRKTTPVSIADTSTISEFGVTAPPEPAPAPVPAAPVQTSIPVVQPPVQQIPSNPVPSQPVIVQQQIPPQPVQQQTPSVAAQSAPRKNYTPTSPAAIRAAMKSGAISFDTAAQAAESASESPVSSAQAAQNRKRLEIQKQMGEKRSGCVIGAIGLLMVVFIGIIALISGGDIMKQCSYNESFSSAQVMVENGDYEGAIEVLNEIKGYSQTASLLNECYYALGQQAQAEGDYETAIAYYRSTVDFDTALRSRLDLQKEMADSYRTSASELNDSELYQKAYSLYVDILSDAEANEGILTDNELKEIQNKSDAARFDYAKILFEKEEYLEAKGHFEELMYSSYSEADNWYYNTRYCLGRVYFENMDYLSTVQELDCFENSRNGLEDAEYAKAVAYLALSRLYRIDETADADTSTLQQLFSLFMKANEDIESGDLADELRRGMSSQKFDAIKLIGFWRNDNENYIVFENGEISFYLVNEINGGVAEIFSDEISINDNKFSVVVGGKEATIMESISFDSTYEMSPGVLIFVNPYDGKTYRMHRFR